ncbi:hypothetical protein EA472_05135 [Natrarchaeobius oligotrophus]|uniref:Uncharacterized protein n=1 Tax=Natrarchaeobius chitinivorans TaxID=1679083 RepID=A0A3N6NPQ8_NATCH|nr:hypothetical protein EA472_05135 [Natrarchaeobius chitinivorans]
MYNILFYFEFISRLVNGKYFETSNTRFRVNVYYFIFFKRGLSKSSLLLLSSCISAEHDLITI